MVTSVTEKGCQWPVPRVYEDISTQTHHIKPTWELVLASSSPSLLAGHTKSFCFFTYFIELSLLSQHPLAG